MNRSNSRFQCAAIAAAITASFFLSACDFGHKPRALLSDPRDYAASHLHPALQKTIAEYALLLDSQPQRVEGYGVVAELPHTGSGDMPPAIRDILYDMLIKAGASSYVRGTQNISAEKILQSDLIAAVEVRGLIPPLAKRGDSFDLIVNCLPNSQATSLSSGLLWTSELKQIGLTNGALNDTRPIAMGRGPVFLAGPVDALVADPAAPTAAKARLAVRVGRVIGGGRVGEDRPVRLQLFSPSAPIAAAIERAINSRFPSRDKAASADSDSIIALRIPNDYAANPMEFIELVKHMYLVQETPGFSERKATELVAALKDPAAPQKDISLALQSLGRSILPDYIQPQYTNPDPRIRFWAARAGAGLQDVGGMVVLQEFAKEPNSPFQKDAVNAIIQLSRGGDTDRATTTLFDLLKSKNVGDRIRAYEGLVAIRSNAVRSYSVGRKFWMDIVECEGPPLIYATQGNTPRIALIGPPIKLGTGLVYVSPDNALTLSVPEKDAPEAAADAPPAKPATVLTASSAGAPADPKAPATQPAKIKQNVTLYWVSPSGEREPVQVKTSVRLPDIIARLAWIPDPRTPLDPTEQYIGASYQRVAEMLASLCKDQLIEAQFALQKMPEETIRTPTDILNGIRPEGSTQSDPAPTPTTAPAPAPTLETAPQLQPTPMEVTPPKTSNTRPD